MKDIFKSSVRYFYYFFLIALLIWTGSLTVGVVRQVLPENKILPFFALALFDGGALIWMAAFIYMARGTAQRTISIIMCLFDLIGVAVMAIGELLLGGQNFVEVTEFLGMIIIYATGIWTVANLLSAYLYHLFDIQTMHAIQIQSQQDKIVNLALEQTEQLMNDQAARLATQISNQMYFDAVAGLAITPERDSALPASLSAPSAPMVSHNADTVAPKQLPRRASKTKEGDTPPLAN